MKNQRNDFYFDAFVESAQIACEASDLLTEVLKAFSADDLAAPREKMHAIEHRGDEQHHAVTCALAKAFITPIERGDILRLSQTIDDVTDAIEDILIQLDISRVRTIRSDVLPFAGIITESCTAMRSMLEEFPQFRKSKKLRAWVIELNRLEEVGDGMYIERMRRLSGEERDPLKVLVWREIYGLFERCCDACEDVADIVEGIVIGNT